jgi:hypothetical protein
MQNQGILLKWVLEEETEISVGIATVGRGRIQILAEEKYLFPLKRIYTGSRAHTASYAMGRGGVFPGCKSVGA